MPYGIKRTKYGYRRTYTASRGRKLIPTAFKRGGKSNGYTRNVGYYGKFSGANQELKFHDLDIDDVDVDVGGTILEPSINKIAQGVGESQRVGRKCVIKSIQWQYYHHIDLVIAATVAFPAVYRLILYLDKQCNGVAASVLDILETNNFQSHRNLANKNRFNILMDRTVSLNRGAGAGISSGANFFWCPVTQNYKFYKKCNIPIEFDGTTGVIAGIKSNNLGVLILADRGEIGQFISKMRVRFTDS